MLTRLLNLFARTGPDPMQEAHGDIANLSPILAASPGPVAAGAEGFIRQECFAVLPSHEAISAHSEGQCLTQKIRSSLPVHGRRA